MVPLEDDYFDDGIAKPNHYAPGVELWFPFATNSITKEADEAQLVVAVYTNWPPSNWPKPYRDLINYDNDNEDVNWTNNIIFPDERFGFTFSTNIPEMAYGTINEFVTATLPPPYVSFPVRVSRAVTTPHDDHTRYMPESGTDTSSLVAYETTDPDLTPPVIYLAHTNLFLPLGIASYSTYLPKERPEAPTVWVRTTVTVTNTIHLLARVKLGEHWVDEAAGYHPGDHEHAARTNLLVFTEPCGYEVNDPRRNGYREDWHRYLPADRATPAWDASAGPRPVCSLDGSTNVICNPWHNPFGQGLPLVHFNRLLDRAGDIGYIQQPYPNPGHPDTSANSNLWQSICLADPTLLAQYAFPDGTEFSYSSGSVLELFTARATNTPVRGLVHFSTTHTNVVRALLADLTVGIPGSQTNLFGSDIDWMQEVFFAAQQELYAPGNTPIGVGDLCYGIGSVPLYRDATDPSDQSDPSDLSQARPWQGSRGNDLKEDILRGLAERISFRQHVFVICLAGKTTAPSGRTTAIQRAVAIVLRDAYTGRWKVVAWDWL
ncbi:MAG: hypothetical protein GX590_03615 [Lentisphaerae bacterium]|nr:hypothetical protein [Lentisphaerota bacterium]